VLVVVVEFDSAGPESLGADASAAAPAMIRPDEQTAAKTFHVIDKLRPGSAALAVPRTLFTIDSVAKFSLRRGLLGPCPTRRRARRVVLQFLARAGDPRRWFGLTGQQQKTRLSGSEIRADDHERLKAHVIDSFCK
jgi:hypothetical protein